MKTIIVATDYSPASHKALEYAINIAKMTNSKLVLFHSFEPPVPTSTASVAVPMVYKMFEENKSRLEILANSIKKEHILEVSWFTNVSNAEDELFEQVSKLEADLVVMGMRGKSLDRKIFGSVTTSVIRHSKFPVLIVPEDAELRPLDKILFACDYKFIPKPKRLKVLWEVALRSDSNVQFLHIETDKLDEPSSLTNGNPDMLATLEQTMKGIKHSYREMKSDNITAGIKKGIDEFGANMLVMVPHRHGFFDFVFNRSVTRKMAFNTKIPLLTLPYFEKEEEDNQLSGSMQELSGSEA